ncbi:MAG: fibronectin type III domain-containing protein [Patescibacteria group bacterium]|nr:fibronectin type III domain-containing protein [Patescibacteria group bacterium]
MLNFFKPKITIIFPVIIAVVFGFFYFANQAKAATTGTTTSAVYDAGSEIPTNMLSWSETKPANTSIVMQARAGNVAVPDETWTSWITVSNGVPTNDIGTKRYLQYQAILTSDDDASWPFLNDVTWGYTNVLGNLISSAYDSGDAANVLAGIAWTETLPGSSDIKFQLRTSPNGSDWGAWLGPTGADDYYTDPAGGETINSTHADTSDDQWFQYKVFFISDDGINNPTLSDVTISYVVNAPPSIQNVTAVQGSDGVVDISYEIKDTDATSGTVTKNYVTPTFQYSLNAGSSWTSIATTSIDFGDAPENGEVTDTDGDGDIDNKVLEDSFLTYTATWVASTTISDVYSAEFQIKVIINDNELANATASSTSSSGILDTTAPASASLNIYATSTPATLALSATDDSSMQMRISLDSGFSGASWENYSAESTISLATDPDTVYAEFKDAYGNVSAVNATTPPTPLNSMVQDISNLALDTPTYGLFIAWGVVSEPTHSFSSYQVYHSTDGSTYTLESAITDRTENYYADFELVEDSVHYYKIVTIDANSNTSGYSSVVTGTANGVQDGTEGGGGVETTPPVISSVASSGVTTQSATITWDTDELADSRVEYITSSGGDFSGAPYVGVTSMLDTAAGVGEHSVTLSGLSSGATYYYKVKSTDVYGNMASSTLGVDGYSFTTLSGPVISNVSAVETGNNTARIDWITDISSNSYVVYSANSDMSGSTETGTTAEVTSHSVTISELTEGTKYYYYVKSGVAQDKNIVSGIVQYYSFTTSLDSTAPNITAGPTASPVADTSAVISWTTNEASDSQVDYGTVSGNYTLSETSSSLNTSHAVVLSDLTADTVYYYKVTSTDANDNATSSAEYNFTTLETLSEESAVAAREEIARQAGEDSVETTSPGGGIVYVTVPSSGGDTTAPAISDVSVSDITSDSAIVTWKTDENSDSFVEYGGSYGYGYTQGQRGSAMSHRVKLNWLSPQTTYYYRVTSADSAGNLARGTGATFITLSLADELSQQTGEVSFQDVEKLTGELSEQEETGKAESLLELASQAVNKAMDVIKQTVSKVSIGSLESTLMLQQSSIEELARTIPAPVLSGEPRVLTTAKTATVIWQTDKEANSLVAIAPEGEYKAASADPYLQVIGNSTERIRDHIVAIYDLRPDTIYHYQLRSQGPIGPEARSGNFTFRTAKEVLEIGNYAIQNISTTEAAFKWVTNVEADSTVRYTPYRNNTLVREEARTKYDKAITTIHEVNVDDFEPGVIYRVELLSVDIDKNATSKTIDSFSTSEDDLPPIIYQVQTSSAISPGKDIKIQTIISWLTNEPSTTRVYYQAGIASPEEAMAEATNLDANYSKKHVAVITKFEPGKIYSFRVESIDSGGNVSMSKIYTILTPRQSESVFQVIMKNVEDVFGWVGKMKK